MPTYAIGDVQGCFLTLERLLHRIHFEPKRDRLWLVGDLVNRGPRSLEVLRWAREMDRAVTVVLGNHDLHLLGVALGFRSQKPKDTLDPILKAKDRDRLLEWLRRRPLLHREGRHLLVHAGLLPRWSVTKAARLAREVERTLRGRRSHLVLDRAPSPLEWRDDLRGAPRMSAIVDVLTRLRTCTPDGRWPADFTGPPRQAPAGFQPWFSHPNRASTSHLVLFGHWAALGFRRGPGFIALDSGCVWGGRLTAVRLGDGRRFSVPLSD